MSGGQESQDKAGDEGAVEAILTRLETCMRRQQDEGEDEDEDKHEHDYMIRQG